MTPVAKTLAMLAALPMATAAPPQANQIAVLEGLNKTTARVTTFDAPIDQSVHFGTLVVTARACYKRPPEDPPNTAAFLIVDKVQQSSTSIETKRIFSGWMFAASPAVSAMEDPVYDITLLDCKAATTAAPSSGAVGK